MKLDFLATGGAGAPLPRRLVARRMRQLDIRPLDHAGGTIRAGLIALGLFIALIAAFALLAPISGAAIASGEVTVSGDQIAIQPAAPGIVTQVLVREGQAVRAGQPLVRLNGVRSGAQLRQAQAQRDGLQALEARLIAERDGKAALVFPADLTRRAGEPEVAAAMASQRMIFARHRSVQQADRSSSEQDLSASRVKQDAARRQLALINDELADYQMLYKRGFARLTTIRSLERNRAQLEAEVGTGMAAVRQAEIARQRLRDTQTLDTVSQLNQVQQQLVQVGSQLDVSKYLADQDMVRAPAAGRVSGVVPMGPGMVMGSGRTIMEIVPTGRALIVEARVKPQDIDDVRLGQEATIRFSSVNPHGQTAFKGRVVTLSPARIEQNGTAFYKAQIVLDDPQAARREGLTLQPGIPATINIKTRERTLFDYLFAPFTDAMSRSFREE